jgi:hypothetical protein
MDLVHNQERFGMFDAGPCSRLLVLPVFIDAREPRFSESALPLRVAGFGFMILCMLRCDVLTTIVFIDVVAWYPDRILRTILNGATCSDISFRAFSWLCRPDHVHRLYYKAGPIMMYRVSALPVRCMCMAHSC